MIKTVEINGEKKKVNYNAKNTGFKHSDNKISYRYSNNVNERALISDLTTSELIYTIEKNEYFVISKQERKTNKKGWLVLKDYFEYNNLKFTSEKKMFEYILNNK